MFSKHKNNDSQLIGKGVVAAVMRLSVIAAVILTLSACGSADERAASYLARAQSFYAEQDYINAGLEVRNALQILPTNAEARYLHAQISEHQENWRNMFNSLRIVVDVDPDHVPARLKLGTLYVAADLADDAAEQATAALDRLPDNADAHVLQARVFLMREQRDAALNELAEALRLDPANTPGIALQTGIVAEEDPAAALEFLDAAIARVADPTGLREVRIQLLTQQERWEDATNEFQALIESAPEEESYRYRLAQLYAASGDLGAAEQVLREAVSANPSNVIARLGLGEFLASVRSTEAAEEVLLAFMQESPDEYRYALALGRVYDSNGALDDAQEVYRRIIDVAELLPAALEARNRIAAILFFNNEQAAAQTLIDEVLTEEPGNVLALLLHGGLALADGELDSAVADFRTALRNDPNSDRAQLLLARTHMAAQEVELAKEAYERLLEIAPDRGEASLELARIYVAEEDLGRAEALLVERHADSPADRTASRSLIEVLIRQERWTDAETIIAELRGLPNDDGFSDFLLGGLLMAQSRADEAVTAYQRSLEVAPEQPELLQGVVSAYVAAGRPAAAIDPMTEFLARHPDSSWAHHLIGQLYALTDRREEATQQFEAALQQDPAWTPAYGELAAASAQAGDIDGQISTYERGFSANPDNIQLALLLATAYEQADRADDAIGLYEQLLVTQPDLDLAANNLAALLADFRQNSTSLERALAVSRHFATSNLPPYVDTLGWVHYRMENYEEALTLLERAVAAFGDAPQFRYHLGMAYLALDRPDDALAELDLALAGTTVNYTGIEDARATRARLLGLASNQ